jgi:ubiquinone biosynthesis protein
MPPQGDYAHLSRAAYPRLARILTAFAKAGWARYTARFDTPDEARGDTAAVDAATMNAVLLRQTLESLGSTFVKFGQLLSVRRDLLPDAYIEELVKLQDQVPPETTRGGRALVETELGRPTDELFGRFDAEPFAAASIAQVYGAELPDGTSVVVKVQRDAIRDSIDADLSIMHFLARQLERHVAESRKFSPLELVEEFTTTLLAELDFRREGRNADRFRANFRDDPSVVVPAIFWDWTTARVLTMERSTGHRASPTPGDAAAGGSALAADLLRLFLVQIFEHGFFHGNPHPGNVFMLPDGRLCFHDFGIVGELAPEEQDNLAQLLMGVITSDAPWVAEAYFAMGVAGPEVDRRAFGRDLEDALAAFHAAAGHGHAFSEILDQFIRLGQRHRIRLPRAFLLVAKTFMEVESHALLLDPDFDVVASLQHYAPRLMRRLLLPDFRRASGLRAHYRRAHALRTALDALPEIAEGIVAALRDGRVRIELQNDQLRGIEERVERTGNRLSFSLIIASVVVASAIVVSFHAGPHYEGISLLGLFGFVVAGLLGLRWALAVLRSGKL